MKICLMGLDTYSFASWDLAKNGIICKVDLHLSLIWDKHIVLTCQEPEWIFQDFWALRLKEALFVKGCCVRPSFGHFSYLTLKTTWGGRVIKCVFIDEEIEPQSCPAHSGHSNTCVLSHPFNWPPPALLQSHGCMCKPGGRWSAVPHTVVIFGRGNMLTWGLSVFASCSGARLLWPQFLWATFSSVPPKYPRAY